MVYLKRRVFAKKLAGSLLVLPSIITLLSSFKGTKKGTSEIVLPVDFDFASLLSLGFSYEKSRSVRTGELIAHCFVQRAGGEEITCMWVVYNREEYLGTYHDVEYKFLQRHLVESRLGVPQKRILKEGKLWLQSPTESYCLITRLENDELIPDLIMKKYG